MSGKRLTLMSVRTRLMGWEDLKVAGDTLAELIESLISDVRAGTDKGPTQGSRVTVERPLVRARDGAL